MKLFMLSRGHTVKKTKQLKQILVLMTLPILATVSTGINAAEAPPAPVMEAYTCSFNPGKDMDDLMAARDYYVKQADKGGVTLGATYLLSLFKGSLPFDLVWMTPHDSLAAFAATTEAHAASPAVAGVQARFDAVVDCTPNLNSLTPVFQKEGNAPDGEPAFIAAYACTTHDGIGPVEVQDLRGHIAGTVGSLGDAAPNLMFTLEPITAGPTDLDVILFAVNDSVSAWANFTTAVRSSPGGPNLGRHFAAVADCDLALWNAQRVIAPAE
jgi:hypothetical protein